jgi:TonB family protein
MTISVNLSHKAFKRALMASISVHAAILLLISISPSLPKSSTKGMIHYVTFNLGGAPGGGGGGGGGKRAEIPIPPLKKETLRDLTTPQKLQEEPKSALRHPVENPKKEPKTKKDKKTVISKPPATAQVDRAQKNETAESQAGTGTGSGSGTGLKIGGIGNGPGGTGSAFSDQIGLSNFPFTYYVQIIMDRVSASWFTALVSPGVSGNYQTTIFFKIFKDGRISDLKVEESSGIQSLDLSALRAITNAAPFPALPKEYEDEFLGIHLIFEHSK